MYINAEEILPDELLRKIQEYVEGKEIYIPRSRGKRLGWGERNGTRKEIDRRNMEIYSSYLKGDSMDDLIARYHLSYDSIKKILRDCRRKNKRHWAHPTHAEQLGKD